MGRVLPIVRSQERQECSLAVLNINSIVRHCSSLSLFKEAGAMYHLRRVHLVGRYVGLVAGAALLSVPLTAWAEPASPHAQHSAMTHQTPAWAEKLKGQTIVEDTLEGR